MIDSCVAPDESPPGFHRTKYGAEYTSPTGRHWLNLVLYNDWPEWMPWNRGGYNWRTFRFAHLQIEDDAMTAGWDLECVILGLGFHFRYTDQMMFATTEVAARVTEAMKRFDKPEWEP